MKILSAIDLTYNRYSDAIRTYLSKTFADFNQIYNNSTVFGQIISVIESTVQNILLYLEDAFNEQNKFTAMRRKSIYGLAQLTGYNPSLGKASSVEVKMSYIPSTVSNYNAIIPNHTPLVCSQNGLRYTIILPQDAVVMSPSHDNSNKYFHVVEGTVESQGFVSSGGPLYLQRIEYKGLVDEDYIEVRVNDELWERCDNLYDMVADGKQWFYKTSIVGGIILGFGNDVHGRSLKPGDEVTVTYINHHGELGNINAKESVAFAFVNPITDTNGESLNGNSLFHVTLSSQDNVTSGTNMEDVDQVKQMIGYNSRSLVLAAPENYKSFINKFSFCGYNRTWSEPGSLVINSLIMKNYNRQMKDGTDYFKLSPEDFYLSPIQKQSIYDYINNSGSQLAGVVYNICDPELKKYALYLYITLKNTSYDTSLITNKIRALVGDFFCNVNNDIYIPKSDIINLIKNNIEEIDGVNCYFVSHDNEQAIKDGKYTKTYYNYNPGTGTYVTEKEVININKGEDPGIGLDSHGNIYLETNEHYPVLMGGWSYISSKDRENLTYIDDPLIITYE